MRTMPYVLAFIVLVLIYLGLVFLVPTDPVSLQRYGLTESKARVINLTVVIPIVLIWITALYGFVNLKNYSKSVAETKEGPAFNYLTLGVLVLVFSLPLNAIITALVRSISRENPNLLIPLTVTRNHLTVLLSITAFWLLVIGARRLYKTLSKKALPQIPRGFVTGLISLAAIYAWLITSKPINRGVDERVYFLPSWLLIFTIVIPYLLAWKAGLLTTYYLHSYQKNVKGIIFKSAFKDLAFGIAVVVFAAILIQLLTSSSAQLSRLNLTPILGIVYFLLALYAVGYGFMARGAKKLKKIEDL